MRIRITAILLSVLFIYMVFIHITPLVSQEPLIKDGVLDMASLPTASSHLYLNGNWYFVWHELINGSSSTNLLEYSPDFHRVPSTWNHDGYSSQGYGTYILHVKNGIKNRSVWLKIPQLSTAYTIWVDDQLIASAGLVSEDIGLIQGQYIRQLASYHEPGETYNIYVQIANRDYARGGFWYGLEISLNSDIHNTLIQEYIYEAFIFGAFLIMSFYYLYVGLSGKKNTYELYLGSTFLFSALRIGTTGELLLYQLFPRVNYGFFVRLEYISMILGIFFYLKFLRILIGETTRNLPGKIIIYTTLLFVLSIILLPIYIYSRHC